MGNPNHDAKGKFSSGSYSAYEKAMKDYNKEYKKEKKKEGFADPDKPGTPLNRAKKTLDKAQSAWFKEKK